LGKFPKKEKKKRQRGVGSRGVLWPTGRVAPYIQKRVEALRPCVREKGADLRRAQRKETKKGEKPNGGKILREGREDY